MSEVLRHILILHPGPQEIEVKASHFDYDPAKEVVSFYGADGFMRYMFSVSHPWEIHILYGDEDPNVVVIG